MGDHRTAEDCGIQPVRRSFSHGELLQFAVDYMRQFPKGEDEVCSRWHQDLGLVTMFVHELWEKRS